MDGAELRTDGSGSMFFHAIDFPWERVVELRTSDHGRTWTLPASGTRP